MGNLGNLRRWTSEVPHCPICEGPCQCDFGRTPYAFPDRLPKEPPERAHDAPAPKAKKPNPRGRRMVRPAEDRMVKGPEEDR